ncbi:MAG: hypothetical protein IME97_09810, partial [Proteobacteria bacterium]|nr:hypothetical protein [Pseudomonadota bacterium]
MTHLTRKLRVGSILAMALMLSFFLVAMTDRAEAVSMGPYVDVASGSGTLEWDFTGNEYDVDTSSVAVGFVLDTSPLGKTIFSYRLNVGLEGQELKDDYGLIRDLGGIYCENIFAFGFVKKTNLRWWGGPLVRFGFYSGETDTYVFSGDRWKDEYDIFQFGIGFVTGVNIKAGRVLVLA